MKHFTGQKLSKRLCNMGPEWCPCLHSQQCNWSHILCLLTVAAIIQFKIAALTFNWFRGSGPDHLKQGCLPNSPKLGFRVRLRVSVSANRGFGESGLNPSKSSAQSRTCHVGHSVRLATTACLLSRQTHLLACKVSPSRLQSSRMHFHPISAHHTTVTDSSDLS